MTALFVLVIGDEWMNTTTVPEDELTPTELLKERDAEIKELHARLEAKRHMIIALSAAAHHRDVADLASEPGWPAAHRETHHQSNDSKGSEASGSSW